MKNKCFAVANSFRFAFLGILYCIRHERNFRIHLVVAGYVGFLAVYLKVSRFQLAVLFLTISAVLSLELVNTALESAVDLCCKTAHPLAKAAKDTAAGAVLISAIGSIGVGSCILWKPKKLLELGKTIISLPSCFFLCVGLLVIGWFFIFCFPSKHPDKKNLT